MSEADTEPPYRALSPSMSVQGMLEFWMTAALGARNLVKVDAGVVHALLNARYYDSSKGEFLSEDPVFWGKQNLANPQSLNSYSYANDNPVSLSDPSGLATISGTGKAILSQLSAQLKGALAYLQSVATNPSGFAGNVAAGASIVRSNPAGVANAYASGIRQSVGQTVRDLYYGDDATQDQALASSIIFFGSLAVPDSEGAQLVARATRTRGATWLPCGTGRFQRVTRLRHDGRGNGESRLHES